MLGGGAPWLGLDPSCSGLCGVFRVFVRRVDILAFEFCHFGIGMKGREVQPLCLFVCSLASLSKEAMFRGYVKSLSSVISVIAVRR